MAAAEELFYAVIQKLRQFAENAEQDQLVLITDALEKEVEKFVLEHWFRRFNDVRYDLQDVKNEFETAILKLYMDRFERFFYNMEKVCRLLSCFGFSSEAVRLNDISTRIKGISDKLDAIKNEKDSFLSTRSRLKSKYSSRDDVFKLLEKDLESLIIVFKNALQQLKLELVRLGIGYM